MLASNVPVPFSGEHTPILLRCGSLRGLTIFDVLISMLFEVRFPFRFPHAVGESGKRNWEVSWRGGVVEQFAESRGIRFG
jgi:hypothetical protein